MNSSLWLQRAKALGRSRPQSNERPPARTRVYPGMAPFRARAPDRSNRPVTRRSAPPC